MEAYVRALLNPFDKTFPQLKILDGAATRSSGVSFTNVGNFTLDSTGAATYVVLFPGFSNGLAWKRPADSTYQKPTNYPSHVGNISDRNNVQRIRLVSAGLRLSLLNSSDDNEGYWEAVRIPLQKANFTQADFFAPLGEDFAILPQSPYVLPDMANHATYQTGRLRELHRFQFKLNSASAEHSFKSMDNATATSDVTSAMDSEAFDVVVIKLVGRVDAVTPSIIMYQAVSNQEVEYTEGTALARLAIPSIMLPNMDVILDRTKYALPAIQIA